MTAIRERFAARLRRRFVLAAYAALLIVVLLATAVYIVAVLPRLTWAQLEKLALAGDAAAAGTPVACCHRRPGSPSRPTRRQPDCPPWRCRCGSLALRRTIQCSVADALRTATWRQLRCPARRSRRSGVRNRGDYSANNRRHTPAERDVIRSPRRLSRLGGAGV